MWKGKLQITKEEEKKRKKNTFILKFDQPKGMELLWNNGSGRGLILWSLDNNKGFCSLGESKIKLLLKKYALKGLNL